MEHDPMDKIQQVNSMGAPGAGAAPSTGALSANRAESRATGGPQASHDHQPTGGDQVEGQHDSADQGSIPNFGSSFGAEPIQAPEGFQARCFKVVKKEVKRCGE